MPDEGSTILVVGATGATGRWLVEQLLSRDCRIRAIVRSPEKMLAHERLTVIHASLLDLTDDELAAHARGCDAIASCLGHNLTFKGLFGHPRRLVTEAVRRLCKAAPSARFVLMSSSGVRDRTIGESVSFAERCVVGMLRVLIPPHADNEDAAVCLRDAAAEWVAVRPDSLINEEAVTDYDIHSSPTRSAIFNAGKTSRINVAHFMADLITDDATWQKWRGGMPVIYNRTQR